MYRFADCLLAFSTVSLAAQTTQSRQQAEARNEPLTTYAAENMFASYEGQNVESIEIAGRPDLQTSQFASSLIQKASEPFSKDKVNATAAALKAAGHFNAVRIEVNPSAHGVRVLMVLEPADYLGVFEFPGAGRFPYSRLIQVANYPTQTPYNEQQTERDRTRLLNFYRQEGYFQATAGTQVKVDEAHDVANIFFPSQLGRKAKFGKVDIAGLPGNEQSDLEGSLKGWKARFHGAAIRPGKAYYHTTLTHATNYLQNKLAGKGLLAAQVSLEGAEYHADTNRADIHFHVTPGVVTHVNITGAHLWGWDKKKLLPMYQGIGVDEETVQEGRQALASFFQKKGYFDVRVNARLEKTPDDTVVYQITKEKKHKVETVKVTGNRELKSSQLKPSIAVEKKHFFSHGTFSEKLVRTSVDNLKGVYQSEGFSSAQVVPNVKNESNGDIDVTFTVTEGPRNIVNSLTVVGADTFPASQYAPHGLKVVADAPYSAANVNADRGNIMANYLRAGYLVSTFRETASEVSQNEPHRINVVYHIYEGPRVSTGDVVTLGRMHTRQKLIDKDITDLKPDQPLTETSLLIAGTKLYDHVGVFDWAEVDPKRPITTQHTEDVLVKVHEAQRNRITYGFGFEVINRGGSIPSGTVALPNLPPVGLPSNFTTSQATFWGPRGTFQYTRNNLRGKGESFSFTAFAGRLDQRVAAYYIDPNFFWSPWRATPSFSYEKNEENPIFSSQQEQGTFQIQRPIDKAEKNILFLRYGYSHTNLTHVLIPALVSPADQNVLLSTLSANLTRDTRDNPLDEHRGVLDSVEVDFNSSALGSNVDFTKLTAQSAFYKEKFHHIVWADSIRIGLAQPFNSSRVPISESFFTGGGNSLRGWPLDGAGPQRQVQVCSSGSSSACTFIQVPAGGNELLIINSEARIPIPAINKNLSIVPFYDGGDVFPRVGFHDFTSLYSNNVGIGVRYSTPVGPVRFDVGRNLNPVSGVKSFQYFISIGQAF